MQCYRCGHELDEPIFRCPECNVLFNGSREAMNTRKRLQKAARKAAQQERIAARSWTQTKGMAVMLAGVFVLPV